MRMAVLLDYSWIDQGNGLLAYVSKDMVPNFRELGLQDQWQLDLPTRSEGPHWIENRNWFKDYVQGAPQWETMFHGSKSVGVYSTASTWGRPGGGIMLSDDRGKSHRHLDQGEGTYFHTERNKLKAHNYAQYEPVFADGTYIEVWFEARMDRAWRLPKKHEDQKIQMGNQDCKPPVGGALEDRRYSRSLSSSTM